MRDWIMVDVEADGPCPGLYSMVSLGAVEVFNLDNIFYREIQPISGLYQKEALKVCEFTREQTLKFEDPRKTMHDFYKFVSFFEKPMFISDNNGFDWQFVNYYFHCFVCENPFGHSSTNLGSLYKGCVGSFRKNFKHLRPKGSHTHNALDDAIGNAKAFLKVIDKFNLEL